MKNELSKLDLIARDSRYAEGPSSRMVAYTYEIFSRYLSEGSVLELGPAEGLMTRQLAGWASDLTLVEGSETFCNDLRKSYPTANVQHSLFESYTPNRTFDNIIMSHVLEHVEDPSHLIRIASDWLTPIKGRIFAAVPNSRSIHRQAAVLMGLLPVEDALNELDIHHGHRRVFNPEQFRAAFTNAGLKIEVFGGYWMKPVSNAQITASWTNEMLSAFFILGERYPDISAEVYIVAKKV